jgi:hypothetical protein
MGHFIFRRNLQMDEIVKAISEKTGLPETQARQAAETVIEMLKDKLPAPLAGQLDGLIDGKGGGLGDVAKTLGGLFG